MRWDPFSSNVFDELRHLQRAFNRTLAPAGSGYLEEIPVNVWSGQDRHVLRTLIPGADPASIDVTVVGDTVTVRGKRRESTVDSSANCLRQERPTEEFVRSFQLPNVIDITKTTATYVNGILSVELMVAEEERPRKIPLKIA